MSRKNRLYLTALLTLYAALFPAAGHFGRKDIAGMAARDIYDILRNAYTLRGYSYGIIGQPVYFSRTGKDISGADIYINGVPYGETVSDLSFLSVDMIDSMLIEDMPVSGSGLRLDIYTREYHPEKPVSEVRYKDAFFNYRDLSAVAAQQVSPGFDISVYAEILDFKDDRDYSDAFRFPYMKQNYCLRSSLPGLLNFSPGLEISYSVEDKYLLDSDSSSVKSERIRTALYLDRDSGKGSFSRTGAVLLSDDEDTEGLIFSRFNVPLPAGELSSETAAGSSGKRYYGYSELFIRGAYPALWEAGAYFRTQESEENLYSVKASLKKLFPVITLGAESCYSPGTSGKNSENTFTSVNAERTFFRDRTPLTLHAGTDIFYSGTPSFYYRTGFSFKFSHIGLGSDIIVSDKKDVPGMINYNAVSHLGYSGAFFNDKLTLNSGFYHNYSEYSAGSETQIMNDLSFSIRAGILNFEFFFGSANFLKDRYRAGNVSFDLNPHYIYSTIEGYEMRTRDEIWGVKWIFYR